ncbi:COMM domain-containing protein [Entamoeba marina]
MQKDHVECSDFDWRVSMTLGSDMMASMQQPNLLLFLKQDNKRQPYNLEFNIEEAEAFVKQLALISKECKNINN